MDLNAIPKDPTINWILAAIVLLCALGVGLLLRKQFSFISEQAKNGREALQTMVDYVDKRSQSDAERATLDRESTERNYDKICKTHREAIGQLLKTQRDSSGKLEALAGNVCDLVEAVKDHGRIVQQSESMIREMHVHIQRGDDVG